MRRWETRCVSKSWPGWRSASWPPWWRRKRPRQRGRWHANNDPTTDRAAADFWHHPRRSSDGWRISDVASQAAALWAPRCLYASGDRAAHAACGRARPKPTLDRDARRAGTAGRLDNHRSAERRGRKERLMSGEGRFKHFCAAVGASLGATLGDGRRHWWIFRRSPAAVRRRSRRRFLPTLT